MDVGILMPFASDGYDAYAKASEVLSTLERRREMIGPFEYTTAFRYGGIPFDEAKASMELFTEEVLPVLKTWD